MLFFVISTIMLNEYFVKFKAIMQFIIKNNYFNILKIDYLLNYSIKLRI
jgi:hypothetical protein